MNFIEGGLLSRVDEHFLTRAKPVPTPSFSLLHISYPFLPPRCYVVPVEQLQKF